MEKQHTTMDVKVQELKPQTEQAILGNYVNLSDPKAAAFCVDGRNGPIKIGNEPVAATAYPQTLGGDLNAAAVEWLLKGGQGDFKEQVNTTFTHLETRGYKLGVHTGHHADEQKSDCGFADQMLAIMTNLKDYSDEIFGLLIKAAPAIGSQKDLWKEVIDLVNQADLKKIPAGKDLVDGAKNRKGVALQTLEGDHQELAAVVNLKPNTTLDVDKNQDHQAFNLDLWYLEKQMEALGYKGKNLDKAKLLTLGLYVATEMKLVEQNPKKNYRLPILVNQ